MRSRILNASIAKLGLAVLLALTFVGAIGVMASSGQHGRAQAAVAAANAPRGWYIDANGLPHLLPKGANAIPGRSGDYAGMWFRGDTLDAVATVTPAPLVDTTPDVKKSTDVTVNVDFDATKPIAVTGLPAYRAGSPELWGDNTGSIADAAADIVVLRANTATTNCGTLDLSLSRTGLANVVTGNAPAASVIGDVSVAGSARQVGSTVQKFCVYPRHISATTTTGSAGPVVWSDGFLAGQSFKLNIWVYAP